MQRLLHEQIYLDTNIFIAAVEAFNQVALELFRMADKGLIFFMTSEVTRGELLVKPIMNGQESLSQRYETLLDNNEGVETLALDAEISRAAAHLSAKVGLELLDAVHCASATVANCSYIISEDKDLRTYSTVDVLSLNDLEALS